MGLGSMRLTEMREYIRVVRELLSGNMVEWECEGVRRKIRFLNPEGFINITDRIPLHIPAFAPKAAPEHRTDHRNLVSRQSLERGPTGLDEEASVSQATMPRYLPAQDRRPTQ